MAKNGIKNAYALLGFSFLIVFVGAYLLLEKANAPTTHKVNSTNTMNLILTSSAFTDGGIIPSKYTCDGEGISPELLIEGVPEGTESLVLLMDDPDIPESVKNSMDIESYDHWVLYNIPSDTRVIPEGMSVGTEGLTSNGTTEYVGACPPDREHRYVFRLYALKNTLTFDKVPTLAEVESQAKSSMLASSTLTGRYERGKNY